MNSSDMKRCPYCAEEIKAEAVKCRYCGSTLDTGQREADTHEHWTRIREGRRIAGVCTGIAHELNAPGLVLPVRLFFIITTFLSGFGLVLYALLWILMPSPKQPPHPGTNHSTEASKPVHKTGVLTIPEKSTQSRQTDRNAGGQTAFIGLLLVAIGVILLMSKMGIGWWDWPHGFPFFHMPDMPLFRPIWEIHMIPFPLLAIVAVVLFALLVGVLRFFKVVLGCGLVAVSMLFLLILIPFAPAVLNVPALIIVGVPVLILVGLILLIVGGIRLIIG